MSNPMDRRRFFKLSGSAGLAASIWPGLLSANGIKKETVRIGVIGVGLRGTWHLSNLIRRNDVEVPAICDIDSSRIDLNQSNLVKAGRKKAKAYQSGPYAYRDMLEKEKLDGVVIATPWVWHIPMCLDAMFAGIVPGSEVAGAFSVQECWNLVNTHQKTGTHMMFLENVNYRRDVMAILNMVRLGLFGELIHCRCGYQHDLRDVKFRDGCEFGEKGKHESVWRTQHSVKRNGDLYPTHGIGPVAMMLDINRGNRFTRLTSSATKSRGLNAHILKNGGKDHPNAGIRFELGDIVTTTLTCANGETVILTHDTNLPRPYSLGFRVQGSKGIWMVDGNQIYIEGQSRQSHRWEAADDYLHVYDHPLWQKYGNDAQGAGHGGMDFFVLNAFIESLKREASPPIDVYDAATWSAITPLSEQSVAEGGEPQSVPDFTQGRWIWRKNDFAQNDVY